MSCFEFQLNEKMKIVNFTIDRYSNARCVKNKLGLWASRYFNTSTPVTRKTSPCSAQTNSTEL